MNNQNIDPSIQVNHFYLFLKYLDICIVGKQYWALLVEISACRINMITQMEVVKRERIPSPPAVQTFSEIGALRLCLRSPLWPLCGPPPCARR